MGLTLELENFGSRAVRKAATSDGVRRFAKNAVSEQKDDDGNLLAKLWNGGNRFGGFLMKKTLSLLCQGLAFSWSSYWGLCTTARVFILNFNWNASDAELDSQIKSNFNGLGSSLGGFVGNTLGWITCGFLPGVAIATFNEAMGLYILKEVGEEALEEIASNLAALIRQTAISLYKATVTFAYKQVRTLWRKPDSKLRKELEAQGMSKDKIDQAITDRSKPWSFAGRIEKLVDNIPIEFVKNFVENLIEEFDDSCTEAGYVVANSLDSWFAMQKMANQSLLGEEKIVEITLDRSTDDSTDNQ